MKLDKATMKKLMFLIAFTIILLTIISNAGKVASAAGYVLGLLFPLLLGAAIAFVLNVPLCFIEAKLFGKGAKATWKIKRPLCILVSIMIILGIIAAVMLLVIPEVIKTVKLMFQLVPDFVDKLKLKAEHYYNSYPEIKKWADSLQNNREEITGTIINIAKNGAGGLVGSTFGIITSVFGGIVNFIVGFIFALYILANKEILHAQVIKLLKVWFSDDQSDKFLHICSVANGIFRRFVVGQFTEAIILGVLCMLGMLIFRFPYAAMVGALVGITALIPIVGGFIGAGVGAFMIMMDDPVQAALFLLFIIVLQQIEGNLIYPKVVGSSVGLPPMWVLAAVTVGGGLMGITGMLLGVPVASTIYSLVRDDVNRRWEHKYERKRKMEEIAKLARLAQPAQEEEAVRVKSHREENKDN